MNADRLIAMLVRMLMRHGMRAISKQARANMTPKERAQDEQVQKQTGRAKQAMRLSRKIGRF